MQVNAIMVVLIKHRLKGAPRFQEIITQHGCIIKTRLGVHEAGTACAEDGLIILHLIGSNDDIARLRESINSIDGVRSKLVSLNF